MKALRSISAVLGAVMILSVSAYADHDRYGRGGYDRGGTTVLVILKCPTIITATGSSP